MDRYPQSNTDQDQCKNSANIHWDGWFTPYLDDSISCYSYPPPQSSLILLSSTAGALSFCLHLLSIHPEVQDKLRKELIEEEVNAETILKLPFLDCVINETLRMYPPALWTNRGLTSDITLTSKDGSKELVLPTGSNVFIPIWAVHRKFLSLYLFSLISPADSKYNWGEDAYQFKPERFEQKPKRFGKSRPRATIE